MAEPADPLTEPGTADLTAHVDFAAFAAAARAAGAATHGPVAAGPLPHPPRPVPAHRPAGAHPAARPGTRPDRGGPPPRRTEPHGPAVQGAGPVQPGLPTPPGSSRDALDNIPAHRQKPAMPLTADSLRVPHGFFTRQGGVSGGPYASLNCSLSGRRRARCGAGEPRPRRPRDRRQTGSTWSG